MSEVTARKPLSRKVAAGALSGSISVIFLYILFSLGIVLPPHIGVEITNLISFGVGWITPEN